MDGRKNNKGTKGNKGGRKPKADEQQIVEKLTPIEPIALYALTEAIKEGEGWAVKLYYDYYWGKPKESRDVNISGDALQLNAMFNIDPLNVQTNTSTDKDSETE